MSRPIYHTQPCKVIRNIGTASLLTKDRDDDFLYPVTVISRSDSRTEDRTMAVNKFETGLTVEPPPGYYYQIFGNEDIHNLGYFLLPKAQNNLEQNLTVSLFKFGDLEDIDLPMVVGFIVFMKTEFLYISSESSTADEEITPYRSGILRQKSIKIPLKEGKTSTMY